MRVYLPPDTSIGCSRIRFRCMSLVSGMHRRRHLSYSSKAEKMVPNTFLPGLRKHRKKVSLDNTVIGIVQGTPSIPTMLTRQIRVLRQCTISNVCRCSNRCPFGRSPESKHHGKDLARMDPRVSRCWRAIFPCLCLSSHNPSQRSPPRRHHPRNPHPQNIHPNANFRPPSPRHHRPPWHRPSLRLDLQTSIS